MADKESLDVMQGSAVVGKLCLDLTVYWRGSVFERAAGVSHFYERTMAEIGEHVRFYETGTMAGARPLRKDSLQMLPTWLKSRPRRDIYMINLESGAKRNEPSDRNFYFVADEDDDEPLGAMRVALPVAESDAPDAYLSFVTSLVEQLDFESGHALFALNWDSRGDISPDASARMGGLVRRYQGVDMFELDVTLVSMRKTKPAGVKTAGWLTLLGPALIDALGGVARLRKALPKTCTVYDVPTGVIIRAGKRPLLGDRNRNQDMAVYRNVGRLLAPFRFTDHRALLSTGHESTEEWLARFDE
jgi:Protein of unknown function (DUF3396)